MAARDWKDSREGRQRGAPSGAREHWVENSHPVVLQQSSITMVKKNPHDV